MDWKLLVILSIFILLAIIIDYIRAKKSRKLVYIVIWAYYFIGMPLIEKNEMNVIISAIYVFLGFIITIGFTYWDLSKTSKEDNQLYL